MKALTPFALSSLFFLPHLATADPVDESEVTTFSAGAPACAGEVNQTIQALITAINDNAARVAELEAASVRPAFETLAERVSGSTYALYSQETGLGEYSQQQAISPPGTSIVAETSGRLGHWSFSEDGTLVLNTDGTLSLTFTGHEREVYVDTYATHDSDSPSFPEIQRVDLSTPIDEVLSDVETGTWTLSGQNLTITVGDPLDDPDTFTFIVSADGNMLMSGISELETEGSVTLHLSGISMGVRTNPRNIRIEEFTGAQIEPNDYIDFEGEVGKFVRRSFRIHNVGDQTLSGLNLVGLSPTCDIELIKGLDGPTLGPGGQMVITLGFTQVPSDTVGSFCTDPIQILSDDPDTPSFQVTLRANYN